MKRKLIALTGKIGSGKSAVSSILRNMGCKTVDCDELAKRIAEQSDVVERVGELLGSECISNGRLNRKVIREIVFKDEKLLERYQQIFFDGVKSLLLETIATFGDCKAVFVEIPVLDAFDFNWDEIWRVESSEKNSVERVAARDGVSADSVLATLNRQKAYECTYVIENNGDFNHLTQAVERALLKSKLI